MGRCAYRKLVIFSVSIQISLGEVERSMASLQRLRYTLWFASERDGAVRKPYRLVTVFFQEEVSSNDDGALRMEHFWATFNSFQVYFFTDYIGGWF